MRAGRKLKLTAAVIRDVTAALSIGATVDIACAYAGVSPGSYYSWIRQAEAALEKLEADSDTVLTKSETLYLKFLNKVETTKAYAAVGWLNVISESADTSPEWARWLLRVRYPDGFSEVTKHDIELEEVVIRVIGGVNLDEV